MTDLQKEYGYPVAGELDLNSSMDQKGFASYNTYDVGGSDNLQVDQSEFSQPGSLSSHVDRHMDAAAPCETSHHPLQPQINSDEATGGKANRNEEGLQSSFGDNLSHGELQEVRVKTFLQDEIVDLNSGKDSLNLPESSLTAGVKERVDSNASPDMDRVTTAANNEKANEVSSLTNDAKERIEVGAISDVNRLITSPDDENANVVPSDRLQPELIECVHEQVEGDTSDERTEALPLIRERGAEYADNEDRDLLNTASVWGEKPPAADALQHSPGRLSNMSSSPVSARQRSDSRIKSSKELSISPRRPDLEKVAPSRKLSTTKDTSSPRRSQRGSLHDNSSPPRRVSTSPRGRHSPAKRQRKDSSASRSPARRRDSSSRYDREYEGRSRSRSPYARDRHRRSPRRYSPQRRSSPARYVSRQLSPRRRRWSPPRNRNNGLGKPGRHLFIAGFDFHTTERDIDRKFSQFGRVRDVRIVRDKRSGDSRGFAFLSMERDGEADSAIRALDETEWHGRVILVEKAKTSGH